MTMSPTASRCPRVACATTTKTMGCAVAGATAPADPAAHVEALSKLLGMTPGHKMDQAVATVTLVATALQQGKTWAQIARTLGYDNGQACKAAIKRLRKHANLTLIKQAMADLEAA